MARYRLHCIGASGNSYKLALYLNCAGLDWEPVGVDFAGGETRTANWRAATNAIGELPVLEVADKRSAKAARARQMPTTESEWTYQPPSDPPPAGE